MGGGGKTSFSEKADARVSTLIWRVFYLTLGDESPDLSVGVRYFRRAVLTADDTVAVGGVIGKKNHSNAYVSMTRFLTRNHRSELKFLVSQAAGGELTFVNDRKLSPSLQVSLCYAFLYRFCSEMPTNIVGRRALCNESTNRLVAPYALNLLRNLLHTY